MSIFDHKSLKKVTLKSTTTHECSTLKTVKSSIILPVHQFIMAPLLVFFINNTYESDVPSIDNEWEYYSKQIWGRISE